MVTVPAVELFLDRARAARAGFTLDADNADAVKLLCRRLDGIPLALELAAARVRSMTPGEIVARLEHRFRLLTGGTRGVANRHQTLRSAIDWSYDLLDGSERKLLARLAVCAGGFTLEAAEAIGAGSDIEALDVDDIIARLADKSLLTVGDRAGRTRYRMLETIRAYAIERLTEAGEADAARDRHAAHYSNLAAEASIGLKSRDEPRWLEMLDDELDNLRAAVTWSLDGANPAVAVDIVTHLAFHGIRMETTVGSWAAAVANAPAAANAARYHVALAFLAWVSFREGQRDEASRLVAEVHARLDSGEVDPAIVCRALSATTAVVASIGLDPTERATQWTEAAQRTGDRYEHALALNMLAVGRTFNGQQGTQEALAGLDHARATACPSALAFCSFATALTLLDTDPARADTLLEDALSYAKTAGNDFAYIVALGSRGGLLSRAGDPRGAA